MRALSLKTRISLSLLAAFVVVAAIGTAFAQGSFRTMEVRHAHDDVQARTDAIRGLIDTRFLALGQDAKAASNDAGNDPVAKVLEKMQGAGFSTSVVLGRDGAVLGASGEAQANQTLRALMMNGAPPPTYPATVYSFQDGWFIVSSRSTDLKTAVVGAMSQSYLSDIFLADALIHHEYAHAVVLEDGAILAASANYAELADEEIRTESAKPSSAIEAKVVGRASSAAIDARVAAMTARFLLSMVVAFGLGGSVTILLVAYSFQPLDRITDAARRLGRGEEELRLQVREKDELGQLAEVLNQSAAALGAARRAQQLAAEDFELTVGELSRSVGEADTPEDVAARLADALLRVTSARAVAVRCGETPLARAERDVADAPMEGAWVEMRGPARADGQLVVALLASAEGELPAAESRKVGILAAQATIAIHRARAAQELREAKAQKETFLDILSHDLKNPLAVARGRLELITRRDPPLAPKLAPIDTAIERATRIIEEAVLLSKLERGDTMERAPLDVVALVSESLGSLAPLAAPGGLALKLDAPEALLWDANPLLQRAVENLVSNAIKWSPPHGVVAVELRERADVCRIRVVDHGPGIPDEDKRRLFGRFERADRSGVKGTGLGLAIALRVTKMHGGTIRIEDTPGGGSTFVIELPRKEITIPPQEARA